MLSVVIIAKDEADRVGAALASVAGLAEEVVVLDSGSTDETVAVAEAAGAVVLRTDWPGFVAQKNRGLAAAAGDWVLSLDADEALTPELARSIRVALGSPTAAGYVVRRQTIWLGHALRHGAAYPDARVRLVRRDAARWVGVDPHDRLEVAGPTPTLAGDLLHRPYRDLGEHLATIDRYTALDARAGGWSDVLLRPPWAFFRDFVLRGGFRDGWPGFAFAALGATYTALKWSRAHWGRR